VARKSLTPASKTNNMRAFGVSTPVVVFHRGTKFRVKDELARSRSASQYRQELVSGDFARLLNELKSLIRQLQVKPKAGSKGASTRGRQEPSAVWKRLLLVWDFSPRESYAARFLNSIRLRLKSDLANERKEGEEARDIVIRLLFDSQWPRFGRPIGKPQELLPAKLRAEREKLLEEVKAIFGECRRHQRGKKWRADALRHIIAREIPMRILTPRIDRLLVRRKLRPVDVVNQLLAWKHGTRAAAIQNITSTKSETSDILYG
jgi:hypothetical protein